jgi:hypothetical protein
VNILTKHNSCVARFDSPEEYRAYLQSSEVRSYNWLGDSWSGGTFDQCADKLYHGDTSTVADAEKIMSQLADAHIFSFDVPLTVPSVVGHMPLVPAAITGVPESMLARQYEPQQSNRSPLTIYIETTVSAGVSHNELIKRGVAALAFALAMNTIRPVEVYAISMGSPGKTKYNATGAIVKIESKPLDIGRAAWILTNPGYCRTLAFSAMGHMAKSTSRRIDWSWNCTPTSQKYIAKMRELCDMSPQDVLISGGHLSDSLMRRDPVAWVRQMIEQHTNQGE